MPEVMTAFCSGRPPWPGIRLMAGLLVCCMAALPASARSPSQELSASGTEALLIKSLHEISDNRMDAALNGIEHLLKTNPNFRLAHLIKGDLLLARTRFIHSIGETSGAEQQLAGLREEAQARLQRYAEQIPHEKIPKYLLQMHADQKYAVVVDTSKARLYIYQNVQGTARYVTDYYATSGKNGADKLKEGDKKTPIGVYFITAKVPREKLTDFYGSNAFPINYPNEWDKRHGRSGFGIWLHGTPSDTYSRPPRASDGCVVLTNQDLDAVATRMQVGMTPVIISSRVEWSKPGDNIALRNELARQMEVWRKDWESRNVDTYLSHYSQDFSSNGENIVQWSQHKRQINHSKTWIKVGISKVGMFLYPDRDDLAVVHFDQDYSSNNLVNKMKKRQYWLKEKTSGRWKIIHEDAV